MRCDVFGRAPRRPRCGTESGVGWETVTAGDNDGHFHHYIEQQRGQGQLILQPRMGFSNTKRMREGLEAVRACPGPVIGTITLDSYTRMGNFGMAGHAIKAGTELNGYPIVSYGAVHNRRLLSGLHSAEFPIQVRHGSPLPEAIVGAIIDAGLDATEGGPISYCLPYGRVPLHESIAAWRRCCDRMAALHTQGTTPHLELFGGCMLGQLCPPSMLVAIVILEGLFSRHYGLKSISLSYAQGSNMAQDLGAISALSRLAEHFLTGVSWHVVVYTFMGKFPETREGARRLIEASVETAVLAGAERLITKTASEAHQIPSVQDNLQAIAWARAAEPLVDRKAPHRLQIRYRDEIYAQARFLIELVLDLAPSLDSSLELAFRRGYLDVPFCLHPDVQNRARSCLDSDGSIQWADLGSIPFPTGLSGSVMSSAAPSSSELMRMLSFNKEHFDSHLGEKQT